MNDSISPKPATTTTNISNCYIPSTPFVEQATIQPHPVGLFSIRDSLITISNPKRRTHDIASVIEK